MMVEVGAAWGCRGVGGFGGGGGAQIQMQVQVSHASFCKISELFDVRACDTGVKKLFTLSLVPNAFFTVVPKP